MSEVDPSFGTPAPGRQLAGLVALVALILGGCATTNHPMMPTPVLYAGPEARTLFADPSVGDRKPPLDLLFVTDREVAKSPEDGSPYTADRARSIAFGSTTVEFGEDISWDVLVKNSVAAERTSPLYLRLGPTTELGRFPPIPYEIAHVPAGMSRMRTVVDTHERAKQALQDEIARRLAIAARKEVVLFVHGYNYSFEDAALTMGELCHFLGREFVCGIFTWPAGGKRGLMFGYDVDRESSEYAVEDLVKTIRIVAATPGVEKVHLLAHSRGTDTLATALSELSAEAYMLRQSLARHFKIANVLLMAPDIDGDVAVSKIFKVFSDPDLPFGGTPDPSAALELSSEFKLTLYVSPDDKALATSSWLMGSIARLGRINSEMFTPHQIEAMSTWGEVDVIQVRGTTDLFGHSYFESNPLVSADIIAMLRYGLRPNEPGRPLEQIEGPFWRIPAQEGRPPQNATVGQLMP
jgi:esterase/lipase superfamily enzyme